MNLRYLLLGLICVFVSGCDHVYRQWEKDAFRTMSWRKDQELIFAPEIKDIGQTYELVLGIRHVYGAQIPKVPVKMRILAPSGRETIKEFTLQVMTAGGKTMASCAGDLCDLEAPVGELVFTEPGEYKLYVTHNAPEERIRGILEFGLEIREKK